MVQPQATVLVNCYQGEEGVVEEDQVLVAVEVDDQDTEEEQPEEAFPFPLVLASLQVTAVQSRAGRSQGRS